MNNFIVIKVISLIRDLKVMVWIIFWWCLVDFRCWVLNSMVNIVSVRVMYQVELVQGIEFSVWVLVLVFDRILNFMEIVFSCSVM